MGLIDTAAGVATVGAALTTVSPVAQRHTFVLGPGRKVLEHTKGGDSIDPSKAVAACALERQPEKAKK